MLWKFFTRKHKENKNDIDIGVVLDKNHDIIEDNYFGAIEKLNSEEEILEAPKEEKGEEKMAKYLVVLDTTNGGDRIKLLDEEGGGDARGLPARLHNFYIVEATTPQQAKDIIMWTFQKSPGYIQRQIGPSLKVTPIGNILKTLEQAGKFWAYISPKGAPRMPGQQAVVPKQRVNPNNPDEVIPMNQPPLPPRSVVDDTPPLPKKPQPETPQVPDMSNMDPNNPMAMMMAAMQQMMGQMANQNNQPVQESIQETTKKSPITVTNVSDPSSDPELMSRLQSNANNGPRHRDTEVPTGEAFDQAELEAQQEIQQFKNMSPDQQSAVSQVEVDLNDNNDINPEEFKTLVNRDLDATENEET